MSIADLSHSEVLRPGNHANAGGEREAEESLAQTVRVRCGVGISVVPEAESLSRLPRQIGDYVIVREIGRGGMGVVYEAEQKSLGRHVALKTLPPRVGDDPHALERFRREARSAARLHHTNIVPVFEVGQDGDTWFYAMQHIQGQSLDRVIASKTIPRPCGVPVEPDEKGDDHYRRVARLSEQVAAALAYAHERGVVHRDIKPSNLILDAAGTVWITDFGIAKGSGESVTRPGEMLGTLAYMAPERFQGQGDARADIYALGLTLYELALWRPAFPSTDHVEIMNLVQKAEPPRPRQIDPHLPRDLETIILKAIEKEPSRRYQSAAELADDLARFRADEPIRARPTGALERLVRAARRNPRLSILTGIVAALALLLVVGAITAAISFRRLAEQERLQADLARAAEHVAEQQRQKAVEESERANRQTDTAREISVFLLGLLEETDPLALSGQGLNPRKLGDQRLTPLAVLDQASARLKTALRDRPAVRAALLAKIGAVYVSCSKFAEARPLLEEALALRLQLHGGDHPDVAESWQHMGYFHQAQLDRSVAAECYQKALAMRERLFGSDHPLVGETLVHLGFLRAGEPESTDAEPMLRRARDIQARHFGKQSREYGIALVALLQYHYVRDEVEKMMPLVVEGQELVKVLGDNRPALVIQEFLQGQLARRLGQYAAAADHFRKAIGQGETWLGESHFFVLLGRTQLANMLQEESHDYAAAEKEYRALLAALERGKQQDSHRVADTLMRLGRTLRDQKRFAEAETVLEKSVKLMRVHGGDLGRCCHILGVVRNNLKKHAEAAEALAEGVAARKKRSGDDKFWYSHVLDAQVQTLLFLKKPEEAAAALREHLPELDRHARPDADYHFRQACRRGLLCKLLAGRAGERDFLAAAQDRAVESLRSAVAAGFNNAAALRSASLRPLHDHPDYAAIVGKVLQPR